MKWMCYMVVSSLVLSQQKQVFAGRIARLSQARIHDFSRGMASIVHSRALLLPWSRSRCTPELQFLLKENTIPDILLVLQGSRLKIHVSLLWFYSLVLLHYNTHHYPVLHIEMQRNRFSQFETRFVTWHTMNSGNLRPRRGTGKMTSTCNTPDFKIVIICWCASESEMHGVAHWSCLVQNHHKLLSNMYMYVCVCVCFILLVQCIIVANSEIKAH